ncbi:hypothetical protein [Lewinella sp. W8]|uniref:hypothetical protein n=1 Tax=Lewinella sp. W8 TaxID=2528208 RepID=UPI001067A60D|nr:hypothetical protein [Lewinella sp. W8]MTB49856.1 hypothetical protein [Lewinella sp. W8]
MHLLALDQLIIFILSVTLAGTPPALSVAAPVPHEEAADGGNVDISGVWTGELYQNAGGIAERFELSMSLRQTDIFMRGTAYVRLDDIWAEMQLSGNQLPNGSWRLTETKILRSQKPDYLSWCMKHYELRVSFTGEGLLLSGPWWGNSELGPCVPGSIKLRKKQKTA